MVKSKLSSPGIIHLEKIIKAPVKKCFASFGSTKSLNRWYDADGVLTKFQLRGQIKADYFPGYEIVAIIKNQMMVQRYTSVIDGVGIWSFVAKNKVTQVVFDHIADGNQGGELLARTFHWQGLLENLCALSEGRNLPFNEGHYEAKRLPRGIRYATCAEYVREMRQVKE